MISPATTQNVQTTRGYVAVFVEDVIRHYLEHLDHRLHILPTNEYRDNTADECHEFEQYFDRRKGELGSCGRPLHPLPKRARLRPIPVAPRHPKVLPDSQSWKPTSSTTEPAPKLRAAPVRLKTSTSPTLSTAPSAPTSNAKSSDHPSTR
ncbi:hypothetical protein [Streptomyces sp. NPDC056549]|uniref:hypothetical protein n=1 Tax=Streptomyces sp. NPDC056549 TaxID=3345864 RepID=UPI0036C94AED